MKPYQFYMVKAFPLLVQGRPSATNTQMTLWGRRSGSRPRSP